MKLAAGSLPWLVVWDLRIRLRESALGTGRRRALLLYGAFVIALHGVAGFILGAMLHSLKTLDPREQASIVGLMLLSLTFFMLMAAGLASLRLIFAGRELTLHLGSPVPFERLLWMRVLALLVTTWSVSILLVTPVANMGAALGHPVFLLAYPVTVAMACCVVAFTLGLMAAVIRVLGILRARKVLQIMQAIVPLSFVMLSVLGRHEHGEGARTSPVHGGGLSSYGALMWLPMRAAAGDWLSLLSMALLSTVSLFVATRFARSAVLAALQAPDAAPTRLRKAAGALRFRNGVFRAIALKEWRTILRDPRIATGLLLQPLIMIPAFYGGLIDGRYRLAGAAATITFVTGQISNYVSNLMISAEEAPVLLAAAPVLRSRIIAYKCTAAMLPVVVLMLVATIWIALQDTWAGLICLICCFGAGFCACAIEIVRPYPAPRRSFVQGGAGRRRREPLDLLGVVVMQLGWMAAAKMLVDRNVWGAAIVFVVIVIPFLGWWRDANRQALLGY